MAKIDLRFLDVYEPETYIKVEAIPEIKDILSGEAIYISGLDKGKHFGLHIDKSTAIKLAKTLRTEINKLPKEVRNG